MGGVTHESSIPGTIGGKSGRRDKQTKSGTIQGNPGRLASMVELKVWRRTERGLQVEEEESVVFLNIEVRVKRAGPSGLGDLEVTEYIARIRSQQFEREDGAPVHLATTEARFMPD